MDFSSLDILTFIGFLALVIGISVYASRKEDSDEDYFLAGRGLPWYIIGISLIASNISSEHFIGMSGKGYSLGLAIASYEWMAAITLIIVAVFFLPRFLRSGIYTIPEYLEYRFNRKVRTTMAVFMLIFYVLVTMATVVYSGALGLEKIFGIDLILGIWLIGIIAGAYTVYGGLKAVVWSDLIQGLTLMIGGLVVMFLAFDLYFDSVAPGQPVFGEGGGWQAFMDNAGDKLHTVLPADHEEMPWVAVFIGGLWLPNLFYWGLNQFITQRTLAAKNLREGQRGVLFGATLKLLIPFIVVFPGIIAFELYADTLGPDGVPLIAKGDESYPYLLQQVLPAGLVGVMFAALFGAVMSTIDSLLNSAATIFTMDIYKPYFKSGASSKQLIRVGRITTLVLVVFACLWAPVVSMSDSLYEYIQKFWGLVQPGIVAAFIFGLLWKKVPSGAAMGAMLLNIPVYAACLLIDEFVFPEGEKIAFLHYMAITFIVLVVFMMAYTLIAPNDKPIKLPVFQDVSLKVPTPIWVWGGIIFLLTAALYVIFA